MNLNIMSDIFDKATELHDGDQEKARDWLNTPHHDFNGISPLSICKPYEGAERVEKHLDMEISAKNKLGPACYRQRSLSILVNRLFKDQRLASKWMNTPDAMYGKEITPLEAIAKSSGHEDIVRSEAHMAVIRDEYRPKNETDKDRIQRLKDVAAEVFGSHEVSLKWLSSNRIRALNCERPIDLLKTKEGTRHVEDILARITYGFFC